MGEFLRRDVGEQLYTYVDPDLDDDEEEDFGDGEDEEESPERSDYDESKLTFETIPIPQVIAERYPFLSELPASIGVIGGVSRSIAREILTGEREPIRDIDLVKISDADRESPLSAETLQELSKKYMPDDYSFGHGIRETSLDDYFQTRDFTINQSIILDGKLIISNLAVDDFRENIIRPTYYIKPYEGGAALGRTFLKALMMRGVISQFSESVPLIEDLERPIVIFPFDIALYLNKAMSRGAETACIFLDDLIEWGIAPEQYRGRPIAFAKETLSHDDKGFEFRPTTDPRFLDAEECGDLSGFFRLPSSMFDYRATDPAVRAAIAEYEDEYGDAAYDTGERAVGQYTQAEYDDINRSRKSNS